MLGDIYTDDGWGGYSVVVSVFAIIILSIIGGLFRVCTGSHFPHDEDLRVEVIRDMANMNGIS